jgi:Trk K+ transport system NAD-binding subunit
MNTIWIIGAGKFGRKATRTLKSLYTNANMVVVDDS